MKRQKEEAIQKKVEEGLKEPQNKKIKFDDTEYLNQLEQIKDDMKSSVQTGD